MSDFNNERPQIEVRSASDGILRRHWLDENKLRIVEQSFAGHRQVAARARRQSIGQSLLTTSARLQRNGELGAYQLLSFAPVTVTKGGGDPAITGSYRWWTVNDRVSGECEGLDRWQCV